MAAVLDAGCVLVFVAIGRSVHSGGLSVAGMAHTAWPFLVGAGTGWLVARAWRYPAAFVPSGVVIWLACVALGMALRVVAGQGTAVAFIVVALAFLGAAILGWRALAHLGSVGRRRMAASRS